MPPAPWAGLGKLVTETQLAELLTTPRRTIQGWRSRGGGPPFIRVGRRAVRYDLSAVAVWLRR
jgi:phage terminase Nu1 subunit (DNA packaging protein)